MRQQHFHRRDKTGIPAVAGRHQNIAKEAIMPGTADRAASEHLAEGGIIQHQQLRQSRHLT